MELTPDEKERLSNCIAELRDLRHVMEGINGNLGVLQKVEIMWRLHVWMLCTFSAGAGSMLTYVVSKFFR